MVTLHSTYFAYVLAWPSLHLRVSAGLHGIALVLHWCRITLFEKHFQIVEYARATFGSHFEKQALKAHFEKEALKRPFEITN